MLQDASIKFYGGGGGGGGGWKTPHRLTRSEMRRPHRVREHNSGVRDNLLLHNKRSRQKIKLNLMRLKTTISRRQQCKAIALFPKKVTLEVGTL